ncbi:MAG: FMN-binding protein [Halothermotrichaceae bacterium]
MKRSILIAVGLILVISLTAFAAEYQSGSFIGFVPNDHGDVVLEVNIAKGNIASVNVISPVKTAATYDYEEGIDAYLEYPAKAVEQQSADIEVVSGATSSYNQYNEAVQMALDIASGNYDGNKFYGLTRNFGHGHTLLEVTVEEGNVTAVDYVTSDFDDSKSAMLMPAKTDSYPHEVALNYYKDFPELAKETANDGDGDFEVDIVSGATHSGHDYNAAFRNALNQAVTAGQADFDL